MSNFVQPAAAPFVCRVPCANSGGGGGGAAVVARMPGILQCVSERVRVSERVSVRWNEAPVLPGLWLKGFGAM